MTSIPQSLDAITPACLEELLAPRWPGVSVRRVVVDGEIHGTATKARLAVDYGTDIGAPRVMWLKAGWEPHSAMLGQVGIYACEPRAYLELIGELPVTAPRCQGGAYDVDALEGVVLLEDLGPSNHKLHTPESKIPVDEAAAMLGMLARMHGASSSPDFFDRHAWIEPVFEGFGRAGDYKTHISDPASLAEFLKQPRAVDYPDGLRDPGKLHAAMARIAEWAERPRPRCLLHGDAHVGNSYLGPGGPGLLDWQCVRHGGWAYDVAYYMVSALSIEDRRAAELHLLQDYLGALHAAGGPRLEWEQALDDFRTCLAWGFVAWLSNSTDFQPEHFNAIVSTRFGVAMLDHGVL